MLKISRQLIQLRPYPLNTQHRQKNTAAEQAENAAHTLAEKAGGGAVSHAHAPAATTMIASHDSDAINHALQGIATGRITLF